ncbi:MAG: hypothetical protein HQL48_06595 [Gammaproteobacteria bacterium]|nr:hypothetical protein [Gammaproteobacteria bacterium]
MQQINLYQSVFIKEKKRFSALTIIVISIVSTMVFGAISGLMWWQQQQLDRQLATATERHQKSNDRLAQVILNYPPKPLEKGLREQVQESRKLLLRRKQLTDAISGADRQQSYGFSQQLAALARRDIKQLWLDTILIQNQGSEILLSGATLNADLVPKYLEGLGEEQVFHGVRFENLEISREEELSTATTLLRFTVNTPLTRVAVEEEEKL